MTRRVKDQLSDLEVKPSKRRGQNFVISSDLISKIIEFGAPKNGEPLVEIGPGLGALTSALAPISNLSVVEIEPNFCEQLRKKFPEINVYCADAREFEFSQLGSNLVAFGNLPYSFSTEILFRLVDNANLFDRAVLLLQKEFVERMAAEPGGRDYGVLSISCQLWAELRLGPIFEGNSFHPPTEVQSRLVELKFRKEPLIPIDQIDWFKRVVKAAFFRRRKKICNSLTASGQFSAELVDQALVSADINAGVRAETLSIKEFARLAKCLHG